MNGNRSIATINAPEFINVEPYNPLISQCEIKVFYLGKNRNGSYITKDVAIQMANSLPGCPIVGAYLEEKEDFGDHGDVIRIEDGEIKFSCKTKPYGFVAPNADVWFQDFIDTDEFGNETERTYLMTTGYLWSGQYGEVDSVLAEGKGQSMELDAETLDGKWATDNNSGMEFFIINDAVFSKLCILGDAVEPCFEGAAVTSPQVSKNFSTDPEFATTLFTMLQELKDALYAKGGSGMPNDAIDQAAENQVEETVELEVEETFTEAQEGDAIVEAVEETVEEGIDEPAADFTEETEVEDANSEELPTEFDAQMVSELEAELDNLRAEVEELRAFKLDVDRKEKEALFAKFYMLDGVDKDKLIEDMDQYSYDELEAKLAVMYVQQNVDFSADVDEVEEIDAEEDPITTFNLEDAAGTDDVPAFVQALRRTKRD